MESLPSELRIEICSHLPHNDLLSLTRTCCSFAAAAKPFLFETLVFHGDEQASQQHVLLRHPCDRKYVGRLKPVELVSLEAAIDEIIELDISKYTTTLQYSPKLYVDDFWLQYRGWVEEWVDRAHELTFEDMDGTMSDAWDSDAEWGHVGVRHEAEARQARPGKEQENIAKAELYWNAKVVEQEQKKAANHAALVRLFRSMPRLDRLQIMEWTCARELNEHGIDGDIDAEVDCQFSNTDILNLHLETLSRALREAGVRIGHLVLPTVYTRSISRNLSVQHLFSGLTSLSFDLHDPAEMLGDYDGPPPSFRTLIQCARHSLEKLEFSNLFAYRPRHPRRGEHLLEKFWGYEPDGGADTLVFPKLKRLELISLVLYTPSLISFLEAQPTLQKVVFKYIYLPTAGYGWSDVAASLPPTCHSLRIDSCGGLSTPRVGLDPQPDSNVEYNHIETFRPYKHPFPKSCGWRASKSYLEYEAEKYIDEHWANHRMSIAERIASAQSCTDPSAGASLGELMKQLLEVDRRIDLKRRESKRKVKIQNHADYERL